MSVDRFEVNIAEMFGEQLWGREQGRTVRDQIIGSFLSQEKSVLLLDFTGVSRIDFSCASEIISVFILRISGELKGRHLLITGLSQFVEENVDAALSKAELCCLFVESDGSWKLIGRYSDTLFNTLKKLKELKQADTPILSNALDIAITSCNNRLKTLVNLGLVKRVELTAPSGGLIYLYYSII
ncbi:hypothetical protein MJA45_18705 [Paenibacillus aurantius]|uniref:Uncharacterized protein n=1 Tax=Paenibacillus aurantius TaxID=2918900 RepID=A0AA96LAN9_9BACL|nr:hypothetical protein [Paenibacillus aurantius]WNQ09649.1 hypothetical protein MJA45_18705 [Paenibacillus aurantius]